MREVALSAEEAVAWAKDAGRALGALRLNEHFPDGVAVAAWAAVMAGERLVLSHTNGMPTPGTWARARALRDLAAGALVEFDTVEVGRLAEAEARRVAVRRAVLAAAVRLPELPGRRVRVQLRHQEAGQASWRVQVDGVDPLTATVARYTLVVAGRVGPQVGAGELDVAATEAFTRRLEVLAGQDAALAYAVLRDQDGMVVEEVVRGVIGPVAWGEVAGPPEVGRVVGGGAVWSACLERASADVAGGRVDDPLADAVIVPGEGERFGVSRLRKWAAPRGREAALTAWLRARGSRGMVYPFG